MTSPDLSPRLAAAADFVRRGARVADIGSDHAYLPIYLCSHGIAQTAIASDINEGPVRNSEENIRAYAMSDRIMTVRANGLSGLEIYDFDTVCVCGMGGELIFDIINVPLVRSRRPELILQPMSSLPDLTASLSSGGYEITDDIFTSEGKRLYRVIKAVYTGVVYFLTPLQKHIGVINLLRRDSLTLEAVRRLKSANERILTSKHNSSNSDFSPESELVCEINRYL